MCVADLHDWYCWAGDNILLTVMDVGLLCWTIVYSSTIRIVKLYLYLNQPPTTNIMCLNFAVYFCKFSANDYYSDEEIEGKLLLLLLLLILILLFVMFKHCDAFINGFRDVRCRVLPLTWIMAFKMSAVALLHLSWIMASKRSAVGCHTNLNNDFQNVCCQVLHKFK